MTAGPERNTAGTAWWANWIAFVSVVVSGLVAWSAVESSTRIGQGQGLLASTAICPDFQTRVLELYDRGMTRDEIVALVNAEAGPDMRDLTNVDLERMGPAYDVFYRPACGGIELLLRADRRVL